MDIFKQKQYLFIAIIVLVILNISTLLMLWIGKPPQPMPMAERPPIEREQEHIKRLLQNQLGFNDKQVAQYLELRREMREQIQQLHEDIMETKRRMFDEVLKENPKTELSDSLLTITQNKQAEIEHLTYQHLLALKQLCKPEQQNRLQLFMHDLFRRPPEGGIPERLPPPPRSR